MDIQSMLPLLMMMNGGKGKGNMPDMIALLNMMGGGGQGQKSKSGMPDMATMMQLMNMLGNGSKGNANNPKSHPNSHKEEQPLNPDLSGISGMVSPEMIELLKALGRRM